MTMNKRKILNYIMIIILSIFNIFTINKINLFINILLMIIEYILVYFLMLKNNKRDNIYLILFSFLFSFCQIIGYNCSLYDMTKLDELSTYINILNLIPIIYLISNIFYNMNFKESDSENKIINILFNKKYSVFILTLIIFLAWVPILISFYPGNFSYDAGTQLRMINFDLITKYHPVIHTLFLYITMVLGNKIFLSYEIGLLIHSIVQMLIMAFIFSYTLIYLHKNKFPNKINIIFLLIYMLLPIHSMFSITTTKDIIFSGLFNLAIIKLIDLSLNTDNFFEKKINIISFIIIFVLLLAFRNNMLYACILFLPFVLIILRKYLKKIMLLFMSIIFIFIAYDLTLTKMFKIPNGPRVEAFSFVVQQLARVYNVENLNIEEKQEIEKLYNNGSLNKYNSHISDPVKSEFNTIEFMGNPKKYLSLYLNLGIKYPMTYIDSIFTNNYSFFYLFDKLPDPNSKTFIEISCLDLRNNTYDRTNDCNRSVESIYNLYYDLLNNATYQRVPVLNILMNMPLYVMIILFITIYILAKKIYKLLIPLLLLICYVITNLIAPVAIVRYMYPLFTCIPLIIYLFYKSKN